MLGRLIKGNEFLTPKNEKHEHLVNYYLQLTSDIQNFNKCNIKDNVLTRNTFTQNNRNGIRKIHIDVKTDKQNDN